MSMVEVSSAITVLTDRAIDKLVLIYLAGWAGGDGEHSHGYFDTDKCAAWCGADCDWDDVERAYARLVEAGYVRTLPGPNEYMNWPPYRGADQDNYIFFDILWGTE